MFSTNAVKGKLLTLLKLTRENGRLKPLPFFYVRLLALLLIFIPFIIILFLYSQIIWYEMSYTVRSTLSPSSPEPIIVTNSSEESLESNIITPVNSDFSIIIPKLNINSNIVAEVDPYNADIYQKALTKGVAHAGGSSTPDLKGNVFLFAHSSANFYEASRYNSIFYLLNKLKQDDEIYISYEGNIYKYKVDKKLTVDAAATNYLTQKTNKQMLTLMTCWPPGTNINRLIVTAELVEDH